MEQVLNLVWLAVALGTCAVVLPRRRDVMAIAAVVALAALLFPIISPSDDLATDRTLIDSFAGILIGFAIVIRLTAVHRIAAESQRFRLLAVLVYSDPRSPPRA